MLYLNKSIDLAACILFYEKLDQTIECIKSLLPSGVNIYILNNGSSSESRQTLGEFCSQHEQIRIFDMALNLGPAAGRNLLLNHVTEEWLLFIDNDAAIRTPDWLARLREHIRENNEVEVFLPRLFYIPGYSYHIHRSLRIIGAKADYEVAPADNFTNYFLAGASFLNRKLFHRLGPFDDGLFAFEEADICIRALLSGNPIKAKLVKDVEFVHAHFNPVKEADKKASLTRHNVDILDASYKRILEKHDVMLEVEWKHWALGETKKANETKQTFSNHKSKSWVKTQLVGHIPVSLKSIYRKLNTRPQVTTYNSVPASCTLFMTNESISHFSECQENPTSRNPKNLTLATVTKFLSLYPDIYAFYLAGYGEPTLCSDFTSIVRLLKAKAKYVGIFTNGSNLDKILELACYHPNRTSINLNKCEHSPLTPNPTENFSSPVETLIKAKAKLKNVGFSFTLNKNNYKNLEHILLLCDSLQPNFLYLQTNLGLCSDNPSEIEKVITSEDLEIIRYIDDIINGRTYVKPRPKYLGTQCLKFSCRSYNFTINLDGDGNIGGCEYRIPPSSKFGNIFTNCDPYNSLKMSRIRELIKQGHCPHKECNYCTKK